MVSFKEFLLMEEDKEIRDSGNLLKKIKGINDKLLNPDEETFIGEKSKAIKTLLNNKSYRQNLSYLFCFYAAVKNDLINTKSGEYARVMDLFKNSGGKNELARLFSTLYDKSEVKDITSTGSLIKKCDKEFSKGDIFNSFSEMKLSDKKDKLIEDIREKINNGSLKLSNDELSKFEDIAQSDSEAAVSGEDIKALEELLKKKSEAKTTPTTNDNTTDATDDNGSNSSTTDDNGEREDDVKETQKKSDVIGAENISSNGLNLPVRELLDAAYDDNPKKIEELLAGWQEKIISKLNNILQARNNKIDKYLKEEQDLLWEGIMSKIQDFKDARELKYRKEKNVEGITDTSHDGNYGKQIEGIIEKAKNQLESACQNINEYNINLKERKNKRIKINQIIRNLIDATYAVFEDAKKNSTRTDADQQRKIKEGERIERGNNNFNSSFRGKDFQQKVEAQKNTIINLFEQTFPKQGQIKTVEDVAKAQIINVIKKSNPEKVIEDFYNLNIVKKNGNQLGDINIIEYLKYKKIDLPSKEIVDQEIKQKEMTKKNPSIVGTIEAIKEIQKNINNYAYFDGAQDFVNELKSVDNQNDTNRQKGLLEQIIKKYGESAKAIVNNISPYKEIMQGQNVQQQPQNNNQEQQNNKLTPEQEKQRKELEDMSHEQQQNDGLIKSTVTTAKCDGLPIGARRYSRAIRRRMNYALNKYM